jgi:uncharacterized protein YgiM (DUF1202 family)
MYRTIFSPILFFIVLTVCTPSLHAQQMYYVQSMRAKIMSAPSFKSRQVGEVGKGFQLTVLGKEGSWLKVKLGPSAGYVPALLLASTPPRQKQGLIKGEESALQHNVRRRASTYTSAAAARGLTAEDRKRLSKEEKADFTSLEKIEAIAIPLEEIVRFSEGGKL